MRITFGRDVTAVLGNVRSVEAQGRDGQIDQSINQLINQSIHHSCQQRQAPLSATGSPRLRQVSVGRGIDSN